jgi:hypothetical protein
VCADLSPPGDWRDSISSPLRHVAPPMSRASSPREMLLTLIPNPLPGPSAVRTRRAANRAFSRPFVPLRQLTVFHLARASICSAAIDKMSGTWCFRGFPRTLITGQMSCLSTGSTLNETRWFSNSAAERDATQPSPALHLAQASKTPAFGNLPFCESRRILSCNTNRAFALLRITVSAPHPCRRQAGRPG